MVLTCATNKPPTEMERVENTLMLFAGRVEANPTESGIKEAARRMREEIKGWQRRRRRGEMMRTNNT